MVHSVSRRGTAPGCLLVLALLASTLLPFPNGALAQTVAPIPSGTGVNIHTWAPWNTTTDLALIRNARFKFVRADLGWRWTEPRKGAEDWTLADQWLAAADANGIRVILTLDYNNPLWSGAADDKVGLNTQANRNAYAQWCERAARHFRNRNVIWEVWNEPNHTPFWKPGPNVAFYADSAKLAYAAVRRAGNDPVIVGAATFCDKNVVDQNTPNNGLTFLNNCFARGALDAADAISVHSYRPGQSQASGRPESVLPFYAALNGVMDTFGKRRPIISGEWGYSRTEVNEQTQAKYLARSFLVNSLAGIPLSIHYNYSDPGTDTTDREQNFGIVGYSNNPRKLWPAYQAAKMVNSVINANVLQSKMVTNQGRNFLLTYVGPAGTTYVAWTIDGTQTIRPALANGGFTVRDYLGRALPNYTGGGLAIDDGPKYLQRLPPKAATAAETEPAPNAKPASDKTPEPTPPAAKPETDTKRTSLRSEAAPLSLSSSEPEAALDTERVVDFKRTFPMGGKQRTYELHLPPVEAESYPCVIVLHGGGSNATQAKVQTLMAPCGDRNGFAVCFPNGTAGYGTAYTWNSGGCCGYAFNRQVDDVAFLAAVIDDIVARYNIDPRRVYLTGMSNGAQMAWHAGCALAGHKVAAFSAVASTASIPQSARAPIPIMQISGLKDPNAPFLGGIGINSVNQFFNLSTPEMVTRAAQFNNCKFPPTVTTGGNFTKTEYSPTSSSGPPVVMYVLNEGGHTWPGGIDITPKMGTGTLVKDFNANQIMWDFFKKAKL